MLRCILRAYPKIINQNAKANTMIAGIKKYRKGIEAQNNGNYSQAIERYMQARGEARAAIGAQSKDKHHLIHGLMAEVSTNIAECLLENMLQLHATSHQSLNDCLPLIKEVVAQINEAQESLLRQKAAMKNAFRANHKGMQASNRELTQQLEKIKLKFRKAKIAIYWNEAVTKIRMADKRYKSLEQKILLQEKDKESQAEKMKLSQALKTDLTEAIALLKAALASAKMLPKAEKDVEEIKDLIINLYEQNRDIFSLIESDASFFDVKQEYLDFMLLQYGNAFHLALAQEHAPKEELLPLYLSVLNVLEDKAKQLNKRNDYMDGKNKKDLIYSCAEIIKFIKKFPLTKFEHLMSVHEKLAIQSYLFTAHHLLSKHYIINPISSKSPGWHCREQEKRRQAHDELACVAAQNYCKLAKATEFEKDAPLYHRLLKLRLFLGKQAMTQTINEVAVHPLFSQDTGSLCVF